MGDILKFEIGCRHCENLMRVGKNTFCCSERAHLDDSSVLPIVDGKHTDDWNACNGEDYKRMSINHSRTS